MSCKYIRLLSKIDIMFILAVETYIYFFLP